MGAHPNVCIEVDREKNAADRRSVVARGTFERLAGGAAVEAVERISDRLRIVAAATAPPMPAWRTFAGRTGGDGIAFRIRITEKHGRFSSPERAAIKES
jgi:uncharacterized protein